MKYKNIVFIIALIFVFVLTPEASAHPGRTDASGGHTCRTNCESWGLGYGEYHYHGGGGSSGSTGQSRQEFLEHRSAVLSSWPTKIPTKNPTQVPTRTPTPTVTVAASPTLASTPTIQPTKKVLSVQSQVRPQKQTGFFDWLLGVFGLR